MKAVHSDLLWSKAVLRAEGFDAGIVDPVKVTEHHAAPWAHEWEEGYQDNFLSDLSAIKWWAVLQQF